MLEGFHGGLRKAAATVSRSRREFLCEATGACLGTALLSSRLRAAQAARCRKAVVVTFGGGARDDETFMPDGRQNIPHLLGELLPRATFFTQVVNRGILGHYVANASLATGVYETINNFVASPPQHPDHLRVFPQGAEAARLRRVGDRARAWASSALARVDILTMALVSEPTWCCPNACWRQPCLPGHVPTTSRSCTTTTSPPLYRPEAGSSANRVRAPDGSFESLGLRVPDGREKSGKPGRAVGVHCAQAHATVCARVFCWITLHDIDIAHAGTFSLYVDAIRRTDRLCAEIWKLIQSEPEYAGKTSSVRPSGLRPRFG